MQQTQRPPSAPTPAQAHAAEVRLRSLGFTPGRPPTYAPMSAAVDRSTCRRLVCPECKRRGESVRALAVCCLRPRRRNLTLPRRPKEMNHVHADHERGGVPLHLQKQPRPLRLLRRSGGGGEGAAAPQPRPASPAPAPSERASPRLIDVKEVARLCSFGSAPSGGWWDSGGSPSPSASRPSWCAGTAPTCWGGSNGRRTTRSPPEPKPGRMTAHARRDRMPTSPRIRGGVGLSRQGPGKPRPVPFAVRRIAYRALHGGKLPEPRPRPFDGAGGAVMRSVAQRLLTVTRRPGRTALGFLGVTAISLPGSSGKVFLFPATAFLAALAER